MKKLIMLVFLFITTISKIGANDQQVSHFEQFERLITEIADRTQRLNMIEEIHEPIAASRWWQCPKYDHEKLQELFSDVPHHEPCTRQNRNCCGKCYVGLREGGYGCEHVNLFNAGAQSVCGAGALGYAIFNPGCAPVITAVGCCIGSIITFALAHENKEATKQWDIVQSDPQSWPQANRTNDITMVE